MRVRATICAALLAFAAPGVLHAEQEAVAGRQAAALASQKVIVPGSTYEFVLGSVRFAPDGSASADRLLVALIAWISENFGIPRSDVLPTIELAKPAQITALRYQGLVGSQVNLAAPARAGQRETVAVYRLTNQTIYLPETWTGSTPAETSVLVHELVHHLQYMAKVKFECPQEMEKLAYKAQDRWLGLFGRDLLQDFEIDGFTLLASTKCFF